MLRKTLLTVVRVVKPSPLSGAISAAVGGGALIMGDNANSDDAQETALKVRCLAAVATTYHGLFSLRPNASKSRNLFSLAVAFVGADQMRRLGLGSGLFL